MIPTRKWIAVATLVMGTALAWRAHAAPSPEEALSVAASLGGQGTDSVRADDGIVRGGPTAGLTAILSVGPMAVGGTAEIAGVTGMAIDTLGGLGGVRWPVAPRLRLLTVVEGGVQTFKGTSFWGSVTPSEASLPYVGGRVGLTWLVTEHLDVGVMAFARGNLGGATMTSREGNFLGGDPTVTTTQLGGFSSGLTAQVGFRFETGRAL